MASDIQAARFKRFLDKYLHLKGGSKPVSLDDVMPVIQVEGPDALEQLVLRGQHLGLVGTSIAAPGAGNFAEVYFVNPAGSGGLVAVDHVILSNPGAAAQQFAALVGLVTPAVINPGVLSDIRLARAPSAVVNGFCGTNTGFTVGGRPGLQPIATLAVGATIALDIAVVLSPGSLLIIASQTGNVQLGPVHFRYRERFAEVTELTQVGSVA